MPHYLFYTNWLEFIKKEKKENLFLFFDFDGTLVPISKNPKDCYLSGELKESLYKLKDKIKIGIISGRDLKDLKRRISVENIYYCGSHGLQIDGPDIKYTNPDVYKLKPYIYEIFSKFKNLSKMYPGVFIEKKSFSFTIHYRQVDGKQRKDLKRLFLQIISNYEEKNIKVINGKMVFEVFPAVDWNKGRAVKFIIENFNRKVLPIFIGDDLTDETVFIEIKDEGLTVKVGYSKKTMAKYFLRNQREVYRFINILKEAFNV